MSLYELSGITRRFGGRTVLSIDRLEIVENGITALLGPNGSGKTTLLNILAFLDRPDAGRIRFRGSAAGFSEKEMAALRREVVLVQQNPVLFSTSVYKNVEFGLKCRDTPEPERRRIVAEVLERVGMSSFIDSRTHKLSGGETQRVAIARALAVRPRVLLFDEPTASVDLEHQGVIERIVADISQDAAVVLTTHDQRLSRRLAHNSVFLLGGRPADPRHENIFSAVLSDAEDGRALVRAAGIELGEVEHRLRGRVKISLDSRSMSIVGDHVGEPGRVIQGRMTRMAEESDGVRLRVDAGLPLRLMASAEDLRSRGLMVGDEVRVLVPPGAIEVLE